MKDVICNIIWKLTWRKKLCPSCLYLKSISNHSFCCECMYGCNYEKMKFYRKEV